MLATIAHFACLVIETDGDRLPKNLTYRDCAAQTEAQKPSESRKFSPCCPVFSREGSPSISDAHEISSIPIRIAVLNPLTRICRRWKTASQHWRAIDRPNLPETLTSGRLTDLQCSRSHSRSFLSRLTRLPEPHHWMIPRNLTTSPVKLHPVPRSALSCKAFGER
jgi:hypothetical protein